MKDIDLLLAHSNMNLIRRIMQNSIDDIKTNHPTRTDLIESMEQRSLELAEIQLVYLRLEKDNESLVSKVWSLHRENLELKKQVQDLKSLL